MIIRSIADMCWPELCAVCNRPIGAERAGPYPICGSCYESLPKQVGPVCSICGCELISEIDVCMRCRSRSFAFANNVSLFPYRGNAMELIRAYKFRGRYSLARFFAERLYDLWKERFVDMPIVPVPARKAAVRRPFYRDHVERIVTILERRYAVKIIRLLERRGGAAQKTLDYEGRMKNLSGKFTPVSGTSSISGSCVLLDDVFTTGATANECAGVLVACGAGVVHVMTVAID